MLNATYWEKHDGFRIVDITIFFKDINKHKATRSQRKVTVVSGMPSDDNSYFNPHLFFVFRHLRQLG